MAWPPIHPFALQRHTSYLPPPRELAVYATVNHCPLRPKVPKLFVFELVASELTSAFSDSANVTGTERPDRVLE